MIYTYFSLISIIRFTLITCYYKTRNIFWMHHNLFTFPSRNMLICCALSFSLSLSNDISRAHEWYRDGDFSTRDASSNVTQRVDELLLHQATRRATSIAVFARHARNSSHAGFPWRMHVALMHALARARACARNVETREGT